MIFAEHVKNSLLSLIQEMSSLPWLFVKNPGADFSRNRKLDFASTIQFILSMESGSLKKELLDYFQFSVDTPSVSAFSQLHLNALYDLREKRYTDVVIQPARKENESLAMTQMIDRYCGQKNTIFIADRGYETYNIFAHVLVLTQKQTNEVKANPQKYKILPNSSPFDYLDLHHRKFYTLNFRVVRFALSENSYECIITNLPIEEFPADQIKKIYAMRWGIENAFRELKYAIGLSCFHSKKAEYIMQEIYVRLILYNYCEIITMHVVIHQKDTKHIYQMNYTMAIHICRYFLRNDISPPNVEKLIQKNLLPIRSGRSDPRKVKPKSAVSFLYRVA